MIGLGNPLRGDDGVGWRLADALGEPHLALHQLTPDCAARLAACRRVLFIDAWVVDGNGAGDGWVVAGTAGGDAGRDGNGAERRAKRGPMLRRLQPAPAAPGLSHHLEPTALLWLADRLYGCSPEAWQLLIPAAAMGHNDALSPALEALLPQARALLHGWLEPNGADLAIQGSGRA